MGIYRTDISNSLVTPDTPPPELESPSVAAFTFRGLEDPYKKARAPISPPMSSYDQTSRTDMSAGRKLEDGQARRDAGRSGPRQQLPSLSSLFGPPSQMRPQHSPLSDRPSPLRSPLDRPTSASASTSATSEKPYPNSYFPAMQPSSTQPRSVLEPKYDHERTSIPSASRRFPGPLSPGQREFEIAQHASRHDSASSTRWSSHSSQFESRRPEYVYSTQDSASSFRPANDQLPYPPLRQKGSQESLGAYRDSAQIPPTSLSHSSGSRGGMAESASVKDGLGPKIWTGSHFLPRFVRQAEVPGEGLCYFYDDGTHCKSVIDGEQVNAHWGVTKAGKPRKRLAIACLTCREKKIKCDPDFPRCVQCEKFGRVCKFKNAPRGGHNTSPVTSPGVHTEGRQLGSHPNEYEPRRQGSTSSASVSPRTTTLPHRSPQLPHVPVKRSHSDYEYVASPTTEASRSYQHETKRPAVSWQQRDLPRVHEVLGRNWQTDSRHHAPL